MNVEIYFPNDRPADPRTLAAEMSVEGIPAITQGSVFYLDEMKFLVGEVEYDYETGSGGNITTRIFLAHA
jgi:hypothetical protein